MLFESDLIAKTAMADREAVKRTYVGKPGKVLQKIFVGKPFNINHELFEANFVVNDSA